jgi:hypothetical protein
MTEWDTDLEILKEHDGRTENKCFKHPEYECEQRPRVDCIACWDVYINRLYVERMGLE